MKYHIFKSSAPFMNTDYTWFVYNGQLLCSMHTTWADAMRAVDEAQRTIEVTLPPYREEYIIDNPKVSNKIKIFSHDMDGSPLIGYVNDNYRLLLEPNELEPLALALLAIHKHNKEARA